ncbi:MAG: twin-arginine translocase subunit TatC [Planctomycetes bacterium]|nr:twin-arginine translocase subunit TatC [Planctomycetota bacterium]
MAAAGPAADDPFAHTRMTLGEHLDELRRRLFRGVLAVAVAFVVSLAYRHEVTALILRPHRQCVQWLNEHYLGLAEERMAADPARRADYFEPDGAFKLAIDPRLVALSPTEPMWFVLKLAGYAALFAGSPYLLWQMWGFVAAGLYPRERRWVRWFFPPALLLFVAGVVFSYVVLVPYGMFYALKDSDPELVKVTLGLGFFFSFLATLCLGMGAVFQLPILMTFLGLVGLVPAATFARLRGYFVVVAFVIAALLTPGPDIFSQVAMAAPLILLYEVGILGARFVRRGEGTTSLGRS